MFLGGVINYLLDERQDPARVRQELHRLPFIVREDFAFDDGSSRATTRTSAIRQVHAGTTSWATTALSRPTRRWQHPRCVYQLMKQHYARYTPEMVERVCGTPKDKFLQVCEMLASTATPTRAMTILYALGWTQHSIGSQIIRTGAMVQLLLGNIGIAGGGMNALRGHSNIQGLTDLGLMSNLLPGYLTLPPRSEQDYDEYIATRALQAAAAEPAELLAELSTSSSSAS